jgi:hypothetical protein
MLTRRNRLDFTSLELAVVVSGLGLLTAPFADILIADRNPVNNCLAARTLVNLNGAETIYDAVNGDYGTLNELYADGRIGLMLSKGKRDGYSYSLSLSPSRDDCVVRAKPTVPGVSVDLNFYMECASGYLTVARSPMVADINSTMWFDLSKTSPEREACALIETQDTYVTSASFDDFLAGVNDLVLANLTIEELDEARDLLVSPDIAAWLTAELSIDMTLSELVDATGPLVAELGGENSDGNHDDELWEALEALLAELQTVEFDEGDSADSEVLVEVMRVVLADD